MYCNLKFCKQYNKLQKVSISWWSLRCLRLLREQGLPPITATLLSFTVLVLNISAKECLWRSSIKVSLEISWIRSHFRAFFSNSKTITNISKCLVDVYFVTPVLFWQKYEQKMIGVYGESTVGITAEQNLDCCFQILDLNFIGHHFPFLFRKGLKVNLIRTGL